MGTLAILLGGIGLFLLGMILMTDGLKSLAGESLQRQLSKFTGGLPRAIFSGTIVTAIIQSSSATTLMTIGFVSAGLLTFTQSVGVILGANLGSTTIGWIVSVIGLKVSVGSFALPLIGVGALLKFIAKDKYAPHGFVLAGFGLLFFGIGTLQDGMSGIAESFSFDTFTQGSFIANVLLVIVGIVMTVILQSSSTAMVITLTALAATAVSFEQAALLVIGQNIGTTVKAYIVTIGGTIQARRTAITHILFNVITAIIAFLLLPFIISFIEKLQPLVNDDSWTISLALFSTLIYVIALVVLIPFLSQFIKLVTRIVPDRGDELTKYLDVSVATVAPVAIEAARRTLVKVTKSTAKIGEQLYKTKQLTPQMRQQLESAQMALVETRQFLSRINEKSFTRGQEDYNKQISLIHAIDHQDRLLRALQETDFVDKAQVEQDVEQLFERVKDLFILLEKNLTYDRNEDLVEQLQQQSLSIAQIRRENRKEIIETTVIDKKDVDDAIEKVHTLHWIDQVVYHVWRSIHHIDQCIH